MILENIVKVNNYADSVFLMSLANRARELSGILEASALMGTPENKALLRDASLLTPQGERARPDDLIIALKAENGEQIKPAVEQILQWMAQRLMATPGEEENSPRTLGAALDRMPEANVVLISVPGRYAAWEAQAALKGDRNVMIFSDHVSLEDEVALKREAAGRGLMVMGPDCGTAILGGQVLGFGNVVTSGSIGMVAASGTGIQEVCSLLDRFDEGISHAIGLGGRDLSAQVAGSSALRAIRLLEADPSTELILFISKPPDPEVAAKMVSALATVQKPCVVCFQGGLEPESQPEGIAIMASLEAAVMRVLYFKEKARNVVKYQVAFQHQLRDRSGSEMARLKDEQRYIRGLFSGGSLCAEAGVVMKGYLPELSTNIGLPGTHRLEQGSKGPGHSLVDLGADEFTVGVPHPMIDFTIRNRRLIQEADDPATAVILFDIVLGYGAHPDPAGAIRPAVLEARRVAEKRGGYLCPVASLCGTRGDPQGLDQQRQILEDSGVVVFPCAAQAVRFAIQVALRGQEKMSSSEHADLDWPAQEMEKRAAPSPAGHLLESPLKVINVGLSTFADSLRQQDVPVLHVDWRPPAGGDQRLLDILRKLR